MYKRQGRKRYIGAFDLVGIIIEPIAIGNFQPRHPAGKQANGARLLHINGIAIFPVKGDRVAWAIVFQRDRLHNGRFGPSWAIGVYNAPVAQPKCQIVCRITNSAKHQHGANARQCFAQRRIQRKSFVLHGFLLWFFPALGIETSSSIFYDTTLLRACPYLSQEIPKRSGETPCM